MRSTDPSRRSFGYQGVGNMLTMCTGKTDKTKEIEQNYGWVAIEFARLHEDVDKIPAALQAEVEKHERLPDVGMSLQDMMRSDSAYPTGLIIAELFQKQTQEDKHSSGPQILIWAAKKGCKELVEDMLCAGVDVNVYDAKRRTPLSYACEQGHDGVSKDLIKKGAANIADDQNCTPLTWAAKKGRTQVVLQFLQMNIDIGLKGGNERTPLSWAAENGHTAVVKLLLGTRKVDVNLKDNTKERTPLLWAAENGHTAVVKLLIKTGKADVELKDNFGWTPLLVAAGNGHIAVVKLLLEIGKADVESKDRVGWTPLLLAADKGHVAVVKLLLEIGKADVDAKTDEGQTALSFAAMHGVKAVVKMLLEIGMADVHLKDNDGRTPMYWAEDSEHYEVVKLLREAGGSLE